MVWKFVGSQLATFSTLPWYENLKSLKSTSNLLDTFHDMEICLKSTSDLLDTSMVWKFVGSQLPTFWTLSWYGNLLEVNFQPFGHFHGMEICWKSTSNLLNTSIVWKFVGSQLPAFWTLPWYGNLLEVNLQPFRHCHGMKICLKSTSNLLDTFHDMEICLKSTSDLLDTSMTRKFVGSRKSPLSGEDTIFQWFWRREIPSKSTVALTFDWFSYREKLRVLLATAVKENTKEYLSFSLLTKKGIQGEWRLLWLFPDRSF